MNTDRMRGLAAGLVCLALTACGSSGTLDNVPGRSAQNVYAVHHLVSDGAVPADHIDANLKNPWGLAFNPAGPDWIANNGTSTSTLYDGTGQAYPANALPLVVSLPSGMNGDASPTGIVYNATLGFASRLAGVPIPSSFIFAGENGTLITWGVANLTGSVIRYDDGAGGAVYKGLAMARSGAADLLYATDFFNNKIDVFDANFSKVTSLGGFADPNLPSDYAPFGIQAIDNQLYVSYARQKGPDNRDEVDGAGLGFVDLFDADGHLIRRLVSQGDLNAPWGIALAPADFGAFSGALLIGNFGDGLINAYDPVSGAHLGRLQQADGSEIRIEGLWGIAFGNGVSQQPANVLFFAAGPNDEADGLYGRIDAVSP